MNNFFNLNPQGFNNIGQLLVQSDALLKVFQQDPVYFAYLRGVGMDFNTNSRLAGRERQQSTNRRDVAVPSWFPAFFPDRVARYLRLPYTVRIQDILGTMQNEQQQLNFLAKRSAATGGGQTIILQGRDGTSLMKAIATPIKYPTATDAQSVMEMTRRVLSTYSNLKRSNIKGNPGQLNLQYGQTVTGQAKDSVPDSLRFTKDTMNLPMQYVDTQVADASKLAKVLPYVDLN